MYSDALFPPLVDETLPRTELCENPPSEANRKSSFQANKSHTLSFMKCSPLKCHNNGERTIVYVTHASKSFRKAQAYNDKRESVGGLWDKIN